MKKSEMKGVKLYMADLYGMKVVMIRDYALYHRYYSELTKNLSTVNIRTNDGVTHELSDDDGDTMILIGWFKPWKISTLAHECSHAAFRICGHVGITLEYDNNEAHAYLLSGMMDTFMGEVKSSTRCKEKK